MLHIRLYMSYILYLHFMFVVNTDAKQNLSNFFKEKIYFKRSNNLTKNLTFTGLNITNKTKISARLTKIWHKVTKLNMCCIIMNIARGKFRLLLVLETKINNTKYCENFKFILKQYVRINKRCWLTVSSFCSTKNRKHFIKTNRHK